MKSDAFNGQLDALIMSVLVDEPAHGYEILQRLRQRSSGLFELAEGTLYPALHRLERDGFLSSAWSKHSGRRRRIYQITASGQATLQRRRQEWRRFSIALEAVLG